MLFLEKAYRARDVQFSLSNPMTNLAIQSVTPTGLNVDERADWCSRMPGTQLPMDLSEHP